MRISDSEVVAVRAVRACVVIPTGRRYDFRAEHNSITSTSHSGCGRHKSDRKETGELFLCNPPVETITNELVFLICTLQDQRRTEDGDRTRRLEQEVISTLTNDEHAHSTEIDLLIRSNLLCDFFCTVGHVFVRGRCLCIQSQYCVPETRLKAELKELAKPCSLPYNPGYKINKGALLP